MLKISENILAESVTETLETMAFMMALPPDEDLATPPESVLVEMKFTGPVSGTAQLVAGWDFLQAMTANVMGLDWDSTEAEQKGINVFKELLNTICGVFLPKLATSQVDTFDVTVPESMVFQSEQDWSEFVARPDVTVWDVEGYAFAGRLTIDG